MGRSAASRSPDGWRRLEAGTDEWERRFPDLAALQAGPSCLAGPAVEAEGHGWGDEACEDCGTPIGRGGASSGWLLERPPAAARWRCDGCHAPG